MTANPDSALRQALDVTLTALREILASAEQDSEASVVVALRAAVAILSSTRQALVAAEKALAEIIHAETTDQGTDEAYDKARSDALRRAREAHALITAALKDSHDRV